MTVYAKCHGPGVGRFVDGAEYEVVGEFCGCFDILDGDTLVRDTWLTPMNADRWERIERADTPESVLKSFETRRETTAAIHDDDGVIAIKITDEGGDLSICYGAPGNCVYMNREHLRAINETVARHDAANTERPSSPLA